MSARRKTLASTKRVNGRELAASPGSAITSDTERFEWVGRYEK